METVYSDGGPSLLRRVTSLEGLIRGSEDYFEEYRKAPQDLTDAMYDCGMYRAFMPIEVGGLEADPVDWLEAVEQVSRWNGSAGWLCMLHDGSTSLAPDPMRRALARDRWIAASNVGRIGGDARPVDGGFVVSGRWPFASGSPEANWFSGACYLLDEDGEIVISPKDDMPLLVSPVVHKSEVTLHDTWNGLGLRGTGSGDFSIDNVFVPFDMMDLTGGWVQRYHITHERGWWGGLAHAAHALGLASGMMDELLLATQQKAARGSYRQERLGKLQTEAVTVGNVDAKLRAARLFLHDITRRTFDQAKVQRHIDYELRVIFHEANVYVTNTALDAAHEIFRLTGVLGVHRGTRIERIIRDVITAGQHGVVTPSQIDSAGEYWLTKDVEGGPFITDVLWTGIQGPHPQYERKWKAPVHMHGVSTTGEKTVVPAR